MKKTKYKELSQDRVGEDASKAEAAEEMLSTSFTSGKWLCVAFQLCHPQPYPPIHLPPHLSICPAAHLIVHTSTHLQLYPGLELVSAQADKWRLVWCLCVRGSPSVHTCAGAHAFVCAWGQESTTDVFLQEPRPVLFVCLFCISQRAGARSG